MLITADTLCTNFNFSTPAVLDFQVAFPNGLDISPLYGSYHDRSAFWRDFLATTAMRKRVGEYITSGLLPGIRADLSDADLSDINLYRTTNMLYAPRALFTRAYFTDANLRESNFASANLEGVFMGGANLAYCVLVGATLKDAHLNGTDLYEADLTSANLTGAYIVRVNFMLAYLANASMVGAQVQGINWDSSYGNLTPETIQYFAKNGIKGPERHD